MGGVQSGKTSWSKFYLIWASKDEFNLAKENGEERRDQMSERFTQPKDSFASWNSF